MVAQKSTINLEALEGRRAKVEASKGGTESELDELSAAVKLLESRSQDLQQRCRRRENSLREISSADFRKLEQLVVQLTGVEPRCWYPPEHDWVEQVQPGSQQA